MVRAVGPRAAVPDKAVRQPWSVHLEDALDCDDLPEALRLLAQMQQHPHRALRENAQFLSAHAAQTPNYAARRVAGQTIGSGTVEKGVDVVVIGG